MNLPTPLKFSIKLSEREKLTFPVAVVLMIMAAIVRTQPHLANVTPFFAISILIGFILGPKRSVVSGLIAVLAMFFGDLVLGLHVTAVFVYTGVAIAAIVGSTFSAMIQNQQTWTRRGLMAFVTSGLASTIFFVVSNLGVWLVGGIYDRTLEGLELCFAMAIPFFTNSLTTDLFFGTILILVASRLLMPQTVSTSAPAIAKVNHGR